MWMRVLLPQVLGPDSDAFPGEVAEFANISRLGNAAAAAALDMLDIAMSPGGARSWGPVIELLEDGTFRGHLQMRP
jgi:hypothetical protein